jgi:hypothetical protein
MDAERRTWQRLFFRVLFYYLVLLFGLVAVLYFFPVLEAYVPVGGLGQLDNSGMFEEVVSTYRAEASSEGMFRGVYRLLEAVVMSVAIAFTLVTMIPVVWVFKATHQDPATKAKDRTVLETIFVLPVVITAIVLIIQNSIALAFGLAGIVAGVQYRNRLALSVDAAYLFAAIAIGLASGIQAVGIGIVMSMWFCLTLIGMKLWNVSPGNADSADPPRIK